MVHDVLHFLVHCFGVILCLHFGTIWCLCHVA
jgi:hypothetical protein